MTRFVFALVAALLASDAVRHAAALDPIHSGQTQSVGSLPLHISTGRGWWARVGLVPRFYEFPAAVPLVSAPGRGTWDVAIAGAGAAIFGAARFGTCIIDVATDRSDDVGLLAGGLDRSSATAELVDQPVHANLVTTASVVASACLEWLGQTDNIAPSGPSAGRLGART